MAIAEDPFIHSEAYQNSKLYRKAVRAISEAIKNESLLSEEYLNAFIQSNPKFFHVYKSVGDYYASKDMPVKAIATYRKAFDCEFPRLIDKTDIEERIKALEE